MAFVNVVGDPEIEDGAVIVRVIVEDPAREDDPGGVFICRMTGFDEITVETFPRGVTPSSDGEHRADAAEAAAKFARSNREQFKELFARLAAK
jgi:hypothetical protein